MTSRAFLAVVVIFVTWAALDFVIHGMLLQSAYQETAALWRPMDQMKMGVMYTVTLINAVSFVILYALLIPEKNVRKGLAYGFWYGLGASVAFGYGAYAVMPIPYYMAFTWFAGSLIEVVVAGLLAGLIVKPRAREIPAPATA